MRNLGISTVQDVAKIPASVRATLLQGVSQYPNPKTYDLSVKFALESWPDQLRALSVPSVGFELTSQERDALQVVAGELDASTEQSELEIAMPNLFKKCGIPWEVFASIIDRCNDAIGTFEAAPFFKLGTRSPKDSMLFVQGDGRVTHGLDVLSYIATSWRAFEDLTEAGLMSVGAGESSLVGILKHMGAAFGSWNAERRAAEGSPSHHLPWLWFREHRTWRPEQEFRCFMREREFAGASQYHGVDPRTPGGQVVYPWIVENASAIESAIKTFFNEQFLPATEGYLRGGVFDVAVDLDLRNVTLIEINPALFSTFPGLFDWKRNDFDGELRWLQDHVPTIVVNPNDGAISRA